MNAIFAIVAFVLVAWLALGILGGPLLIGKPRKPFTMGSYIGVLIVGSITIAYLVYAALSLLGVGR
ncbi:MAG: hypothetical protein K0S65_3644 [Labilithrix sp.]|jgi:hypothetical protein|nr:hypothetical protein [Labilithrix sp.]